VASSSLEKQREYNRRWKAKRTPEKRAAASERQKAVKKAHPNYYEKQIRTSMISRCYAKSNKRFHRYGGRGITVCDRWRESFDNFIADVGPRPSKGHVLDRIDNDGNYEPSNCRWVTWAESYKNMTYPIRTVFEENKRLKEELARARAAEAETTENLHNTQGAWVESRAELMDAYRERDAARAEAAAHFDMARDLMSERDALRAELEKLRGKK
jgi:hypothetical protein